MVQEAKANNRIRTMLSETGMPHWKLADLMGISHWTLSVKMRHEMPEDEQLRIIQLIQDEVQRREAS